MKHHLVAGIPERANSDVGALRSPDGDEDFITQVPVTDVKFLSTSY